MNQLRQKRIDFKQKLRKSFRKQISESFPHSLLQFQHEVIGSISNSFSQQVPEDYLEAFNALPAGTVRFYKSVAADVAGKDRENYPFLTVPMDEEDHEAIEEGLNTSLGVTVEDHMAEIDEEVDGQLNDRRLDKKRKTSPLESPDSKKSKKQRVK